MMYFQLLLTDEENKELEARAAELGISKTAYIKKRLDLKASASNIFTVEYAVNLAKTKWEKGELRAAFTLTELYGDEWENVRYGVAGVLGRSFYKFVLTKPEEGFSICEEKKPIWIAGQKRMQNQYIYNPK